VSRPAGRKVLFLLGPSSPFWRELAEAFEDAGVPTSKVCFSLGDWLYWRRRGAVHYRGRLAQWHGTLDRLIVREGISDILLYADRQPYHVIAAEVAKARGIRLFTVENGYLRPDWITVEQGGMGAFSHFPVDPVQIHALAARVPEPDLTPRHTHGFWTEMLHEATYHLTSYFWRILYPFYRSGKYDDPLLEILLGLPRLLVSRKKQRAAEAAVAALEKGGEGFFLLALQLQGDYQIRANSPYSSIVAMLEEVIASFAAHAPPGDRLVIKQHPHDNGARNWPRHARRLAEAHGVGARVLFLEGGDLGRLLGRARGCVTINSTVGLYALRAGCPVKVLGVALYDLPGLVHQASLACFWQHPEPVDPALAEAFVRALAGTIQIKGSFYAPAGRKAAIETLVARFLPGTLHPPEAFADPPPRLVRARALGVPLPEGQA
jgi:capsular polysaccharide export protein